DQVLSLFDFNLPHSTSRTVPTLSSRKSVPKLEKIFSHMENLNRAYLKALRPHNVLSIKEAPFPIARIPQLKS
ncbi:MAG: hypothetical protein ACHP9Y_05100, partial [Gammaproteobacteria bacterium]